MHYGLSDTELARLNALFAGNDRIEEVVLYGSRAKGNYRPFSDVDITLVGEHLSRADLNSLSLAIDDLLMPYRFDISLYKQLKNPALLDHIHRKGKRIYHQTKSQTI